MYACKGVCVYVSDAHFLMWCLEALSESSTMSFVCVSVYSFSVYVNYPDRWSFNANVALSCYPLEFLHGFSQILPSQMCEATTYACAHHMHTSNGQSSSVYAWNCQSSSVSWFMHENARTWKIPVYYFTHWRFVLLYLLVSCHFNDSHQHMLIIYIRLDKYWYIYSSRSIPWLVGCRYLVTNNYRLKIDWHIAVSKNSILDTQKLLVQTRAIISEWAEKVCRYKHLSFTQEGSNIAIQRSINKQLLAMKISKQLPDSLHKILICSNGLNTRFYGLPKIHKPGRPVSAFYTYM